MTIDAGSGDDTFVVGDNRVPESIQGQRVLDGIQGRLTIAGGGGTNSLTVDDSFVGRRPGPGH